MLTPYAREMDHLRVLWHEARNQNMHDAIEALRESIMHGKDPIPEDIVAVARFIGERTRQNRFGR